jgi:hypothetical protein
VAAGVVVVAAVIVVAAVVTVGSTVVEEEVAAGSPLDHGEVPSFSANTWILKARPFMVGSLYTS